MGRTNVGARLMAGVACASLLACTLVVAGASVASAVVQHGLGYETSPSQPYKHNPDKSDWAGSYVVAGKQVWCVQYAYLAPDSDEQYQPGEPLKTKWGTELSPTVAADISYLLLRYSTTTSADEAAAMSYLLHSWTAAPEGAHTTNPANDFKNIAFDAPFHLAKLPAGAKAAVDRLKADATANHGPWTAKLTAPTGPQIIGTPDKWTVEVRNAAGKGLPAVPVKITLVDATIGGKTTVTVPTGAEGLPLAVDVTPTGPNPKATISLSSPADRPVVRQAVQVNTQRVVSTGGEKELGAAAAVTAVTAPGSAAVAKVDAKTGAGIANVSLRVTGADKVAPAISQDGKPLVGEDGKPAVVLTGADGTVAVPNLRTPQQICVVEVAAPPGYEDGFDPAAPPSACGEVTPGATLKLAVANKANIPPVPTTTPPSPTVPVAIPAGDGQTTAAAFEQDGGPSIMLFAILGTLVLAVGAAVGLIIATRSPRRARYIGQGMRRDWGR